MYQYVELSSGLIKTPGFSLFIRIFKKDSPAPIIHTPSLERT